MDPKGDRVVKKPTDVVLLVLSEDSTDDPIPNRRLSKSLEISRSRPIPTLSPHKPPRHPETILRRRPSIAFPKPRSRFVEQTPLLVPSPASSPFRGTHPAADEEDEEEEDDVYQRGQFPGTENRRRYRVRVKFSVEWVILVWVMGCLVASLTVHRLQRFVIWGLEIWKWCLMVTVVFCGRLFSYWFINILVFMIERNSLLRRKVLYFVYGLKKSVQVCIWLGLVLFAWFLVFNHGIYRSRKTIDTLNYVSRVIVSLLIGSVIWLMKTLSVKILASSFHMNRFFDRIQESIFHQYVLLTLSGPPVMELAENVGKARSTGQLSFRSQGKKRKEVGVIDVAKLHKMKQDKVSAWTMKGLMNVIRSSGLVTISSATDQSFDDPSEQGREITSEWEAKVAANQIFKNVAKPDCKYIEEVDLLRFLIKDEVDNVLPLFQGAAETGKIKKSALKSLVVKAYIDRKSLAHSLNDTKTAVNQLHKLANVLVVVLIIIISLLLMGFATTQVLLLISSQLLLVGFMFGNTCKTAFEAIIFVFVTHPFDVGDRCVVDGIQMIVEEMNILTTVFLRYDNEKIYYPNVVLATKPISNFYRSPEMGDSVLFSVDAKISMDCIGSLKARIKTYIDSKPNHWNPTHSIVVKDIENANKMNMALYVTHTINYQNMGEKNSRRSDLVLELRKIFEGLSIHYDVLPQDDHLSYSGSTPFPMDTSQSF